MRAGGVDVAWVGWVRSYDPTYLPSNPPTTTSPQYLGFDQTISAPHMHAHALELLKDKCVYVYACMRMRATYDDRPLSPT